MFGYARTMRLISLLFALAAFGPSAGSAVAAVLIESVVGDVPVRLISDDESGRVLIESALGGRLIDTTTDSIYEWAGGGTPRLYRLPDRPAGGSHEKNAPYFTLTKIGPGPRVAGYPTSEYHLSVGGQLCSVIHANLGLSLKLTTAVEALVLLDRLNAVRVSGDRPPCERVPYRRYRWIGWGLRIADASSPVIEAVAVDWSYDPPPGSLDLPPAAVEVTLP